jgi:methionyl-tRNA formyltransferase
MRIVFLGTGEIGVPSLRALFLSGHEVCAVFTQPDRPAGRDMKLRPSPIKVVAEELGLPVFQPEKIRAPDACEILAGFQADIAIVVAYGQILPKAVLETPRLGCLNIHASLLPLHRGASPIQAAILAGDSESGVTIMQMDVGLDTGDILVQEGFRLGRHETGGELHDRLAQQAPGLLARTLEIIESGQVQPRVQDGDLATYAPKLSRDDARIDWTLPAVTIGRRIRAFNPWPCASTTFPYQGQSVLLKVHQAAVNSRRHGEPGVVLRADARGILVGAGEGSVLLRQIQAAGGKRLAAKDFLRGRDIPVGTRLG